MAILSMTTFHIVGENEGKNNKWIYKGHTERSDQLSKGKKSAGFNEQCCKINMLYYSFVLLIITNLEKCVCRVGGDAT